MAAVKPARVAAAVMLWCVASFFLPPSASAQSQDNDLSKASLEQLTQMRISVSSFARKDEDLWKTPAAVFVISKEDIARSAASSIPELLRMVPGMQVAQIDASTWAISARGFNNVFADKLLVLIDGRTVYSEIYSGTPWDQIDLPLGDIERIEVIRGPGAAVWGTNAVNGVVNIITSKARSTMGPRATGRFSRISEVADIRYGGTLGARTQYRGFASYINRNALELPSGTDAFDGEDSVRGGGRLDWQRSAADWITTNGDLYGGHLKQQITPLIVLEGVQNGQEYESMAGGHLLSRWEHKFEHSDTALQVYFDDQSRHELGTYVRTQTIDVDYQDHVPAGLHNDLVWGAEFRLTADRLKGAVLPTARPEYKNYLADGFLQDEIAILPRRLILTLGSKIQDGTLAGFQIQPSARILWAPTYRQSLWAAASGATVAPAIQDKDIVTQLSLGTYGPLPVTGTLRGNPGFLPPKVVAYELGYRRRISSTLTLDLASFFNLSRRMEGFEVVSSMLVPTPSPHISTNLLYVNGFHARTAGLEASASWKPLEALSFQAGYAWMQTHQTQSIPGSITVIDSWGTPRNSVNASASWRFAPQWSANGFVAYVDELKPIGLLGTGDIVPAYTRLDLHLARKVGRSLEFDAGGTNLLTPRHLEFGNTGFVPPALVPRSLFIKASWSF